MKKLFSLVCSVAFMASCASGPVAPVAVQSKVVEDGPYRFRSAGSLFFRKEE